MTLRLVGAGLGRTGTNSLKLALEQLLGAPCYHMLEVFLHPEHTEQWHRATRNEPVDWDQLFDGYAAAVDWPVAGFTDVLMEHYPNAPVLLSTRRDAEAWWKSYSETIMLAMEHAEASPWKDMVTDMLVTRFTEEWNDKDRAVAAYEQHNALIRRMVPADRLVEWQPGDGWGPLCAALGVAEPAEPFPHVNKTEDFRAMLGMEAPAS